MTKTRWRVFSCINLPKSTSDQSMSGGDSVAVLKPNIGLKAKNALDLNSALFFADTCSNLSKWALAQNTFSALTKEPEAGYLFSPAGALPFSSIGMPNGRVFNAFSTTIIAL